MAGYRGPSIDHGLLSPSGRASKRSRQYLLDDYKRRCNEYDAIHYPPPSEEEAARKATRAKITELRRHAAELRQWATLGIHPRSYPKEAAKREAQADELELTITEQEARHGVTE